MIKTPLLPHDKISKISVLLLISGSLVFLDQLSKRWILNLVSQGVLPSKITFFLNVVYGKNNGISFGLFKAGNTWGVAALAIGALIIIACLIAWYMKENETSSRAGLLLIISGAGGNMIDRLLYGGVIDFIDIHINYYHFPIFNGADTMISLGTAFILWDAFRART